MIKNLDLFWTSNREWYHYRDGYIAQVNDDAPEEAKKSYEHYKEQMAKATPGSL